MPTGTWDRLAPEKKDAITKVAESEFAKHGFSAASLNTISQRAGVSKGSLFQYFHDKADLWVYIADLASIRIAAHMLDQLERLQGSPSSPLLDELVATWVEYFFDHPADRGLLAAASFDPNPLVATEVRAVTHRHYRAVLKRVQAVGGGPGVFGSHDDTEAVVAVLTTLLPLVALAPHLRGLDPLIGVPPVDRERAVRHAQRLMGVVANR